LPVNVFVVEHPQGLCLFDAGERAEAARPGYFPWWHPFFKLARFELGQEDEAAPQLRALGYDPADVRWVVLSHLHTDHVGGLEAFRSAEVLVSRPEWEHARGPAGSLRGYLPQRWPKGLDPHLVDVDGDTVGPFAGSYDIAGDGRLLLVPLPGHTAGHVGLLVSEHRPTHLLIGDAADDAEELADLQPEVAQFCRDEGVAVLASHGELTEDTA
jgi:glyoxylase-like metal-dependent hydrolase (beta-lactamase superfamily II)